LPNLHGYTHKAADARVPQIQLGTQQADNYEIKSISSKIWFADLVLSEDIPDKTVAVLQLLLMDVEEKGIHPLISYLHNAIYLARHQDTSTAQACDILNHTMGTTMECLKKIEKAPWILQTPILILRC